MFFAVPESSAKKSSLRWTALTAAVASFSLLIVDVGPAAAEIQTENAPVSEVQESPAAENDSSPRPDAVSAQITARSLGTPVEDLSQRTADTMVFANPDGTWTMDAYGLPKFRKTSDGDWVPLEKAPEFTQYGEASFVGSEAQINVSDGKDAQAGVAPLVTLSGTGKDSKDELVLGWEGDLPEPILDGPTATYTQNVTIPVAPADAGNASEPTEPAASATAPSSAESEAPSETVEAPARIIVEGTQTGFSHLVVLDEAPQGDVVLRFPLKLSEGLKAEVTDTGTIEVRDGNNELQFYAPKPLMWDAETNQASGLPANETPIDPTIIEENGQQILTLPVDQEWLADPDRTYPVTIDPTWSKGASDTWVQSDYPYSQAGSPELRAGTFDGGATKARSYLNFDTTAINGKRILDAKLQINNFWSYSCSSATIYAQRVLESWTVSGTTWGNQPSVTSTGQGSYSTAKGFNSSCPDGNAYFPVTSIAQFWADNPTKDFGLRLMAANETNNASWRRYRSANYVDNDNAPIEPHLQVTYNSYPNTPTSGAYGSGQAVVWKDPATGASTTYLKTTKPTISALVTDTDGGNVRIGVDVFNGSTLVWDRHIGPYVASGGRSARVPTSTTPALSSGKSYTVKAFTSDGSLWSKNSMNTLKFTVDTSAPAAPSVTASGVDNGAWVDSKPSTNTFTFTSSATDAVKFQYSKDGGAWTSVNAAGSPATAALNWTPDGAHELRVRAVDKAQNLSPITTFKFGFGGANLDSPVSGESSTDTFRVTATAPSASSGTVTPEIYWRAAGTPEASTFSASTGTTDGWKLAETLPALGSGEAVKVDHDFDGASAATELGKARIPALLDVQVCFTYTSPEATRCTWTDTDGSNTPSVVRLPHAFGNGYPVAEAGPGQAALYTGELNLAETDVSVDAGGTGLSISRIHSSLAGSLANGSVYGPGWRASFDGPDAGLAGFLVADTTGIDGTISLIGADESAVVFRQPGGTKTPQKPGIYTPVNDDAVASGLKVEITGTGTGTRVKATETDGTITVFSAGDSANGVQFWDAEKVAGPANSGTVTFTRDGQGRVTRILAPVEEGIDCTTGALEAGCRALDITYTPAGTGESAGQVDNVGFTAWNPATGAMATVTVAEYQYDTEGRLTKVTDPRNSQSTSYTYGAATSAGVPSVSSLTDSGLAPHKFTYGPGAEETTRTDWLESVNRGPASGTGADVQDSRFVYGIKPTGDGTNLPDLSPTAVKLWDQGKNPAAGAAVFSADKPVTSSNASTVTAADFRYASLQFWDAEGYTVNTADYGAGAWQISATDYDDTGNVVRQFEPTAIAKIKKLATDDPETVTNGTLGNNNEFATITRYITNEAGTFPTDAWAPVAPSGVDEIDKRTHVHTDYTPTSDVDAATGKPRMLPLRNIVTEAEPTEGTIDPEAETAAGEPVLHETVHGYDAPGSTDKANPASGWVHGVPTTVTTVMGTGEANITSTTVLDARGRTVATWQPKSSGNDAGATRSHYYTKALQPENPECGNQAAFAGLICKIEPQGSGSITETITAYDMFLRPTRIVETGDNAATRTTVTTYLADGRVNTESTSTGLAGSKAVPTTKYLYAPATGLNIGAASLDSSGAETSRVSWTLDRWGRPISYVNVDGKETTTEYTPTGQTARTITPYGATSYTYDGNDANGKEERRGLPVAMSVTNHGTDGNTGTYKAAYDEAGSLILQTMPGGIRQERSYDQTGQPIGLAYNGQTTVTADDGTTSTQTGPWVAWTQARNTLGQVTAETTPDGALINGGIEGEAASAYQREYTYDRTGRLTTVKDRTAAPGTSMNTDPTEGEVTGCTTRTYTFDANGNRTGLSAAAPAVDGSCTTAGATAKTWSYDAADRIAYGANGNGTYKYDGLGRQTTIPASDAPTTDVHAAGSGDITVGYYDTDAAHTITRNGTTTTFGLDPEGRRITTTEGASTDTNGYADDSDNPAWVINTTGSAITRTRYESVIGGDLGITITDGAAKLAMNNPHGDTVATVELPTAGNATGIDSWANYDEYGNKTGTTPNTGNTTYAWHGGAQRALDTSGLILMGARLYNTTTGLFTSPDPITGGNTTAYTYPQEPITTTDLTGMYKKCKTICKGIVVGLKAAGVWGCKWAGLVGVLCASVIGGVVEGVKYIYQWKGDKRFSYKKLGKKAGQAALENGLGRGGLYVVGSTIRAVMVRLGVSPKKIKAVVKFFKLKGGRH